jgi:hypothetical protein
VVIMTPFPCVVKKALSELARKKVEANDLELSGQCLHYGKSARLHTVLCRDKVSLIRCVPSQLEVQK